MTVDVGGWSGFFHEQAGMAESLRLEHESTIELHPAAARRLLHSLDALSGQSLPAAGRALHVGSGRSRTRVYVYLRPAGHAGEGVRERTDRVIFDLRPTRIRGRLSSKCWRELAGGVAKFHCGEIRDDAR